VLHRLNSAVTLIQRTTTEAPRRNMYYIGLDVHKKTISILREGREWPDTTGRQGWIDPTRAGQLDEDTASAMECCHGGDDL
jgi:hypothetical protein